MKQTIVQNTQKASKFGMKDRLQAAFSHSANSLGSVNKQLTMQNEQYLEVISCICIRALLKVIFNKLFFSRGF